MSIVSPDFLFHARYDGGKGLPPSKTRDLG
jgi:hypothetical protein